MADWQPTDDAWVGDVSRSGYVRGRDIEVGMRLTHHAQGEEATTVVHTANSYGVRVVRVSFGERGTRDLLPGLMYRLYPAPVDAAGE